MPTAHVLGLLRGEAPNRKMQLPWSLVVFRILSTGIYDWRYGTKPRDPTVSERGVFLDEVIPDLMATLAPLK
jgi:hypothetical protein